MAGRFEKGQHLFFLMSDGKTQQDSQNKPRYYLKQSCARTNTDGFCDTAEQIEEDLEAMIAREAECEACQKCVGTGICVKMEGEGGE